MAVKIKRLLITHPEPLDDSSPYHQLAREYDLQIDFRPFLQVEGTTLNEFRKQNLYPLDFSAIIFTNKSAIDHYFRICRELRIEMPAETKYFCLGEAIAKYLQKYIIIRKRKLYVAEKHISDLVTLFRKHIKEKFLFPTGDLVRPEITDYMEKQNVFFKVGVVYQTVPSELKGILSNQYDLICLYSPTSVEALFHNFPEFEQKQTLIAVFGSLTRTAAENAGLRLDIQAPHPEFPSMTAAIEHYLKQMNANLAS